MSRPVRALAVALALSSSAAAWLFIGARPGAAASILALRPDPIDRPLHIVAADFDRDGADDLVIANFQAGTLTLLINQRDGTFAPHPDSPFPVGTAAFNFPTAGPLHMAVGDLNPEDVDSDGVLNAVDNCPNVYNAVDPLTGIQADQNVNGIGDACEVPLVLDLNGNCTGDSDKDGDGVCDYDPRKLPATDPVAAALDNCPRMANPMQEDANLDHVGDDCAASPDLAIAETSLGGGSPSGIVRIRVNTGSGGLESRPSKVTALGPAEVLLGDFSGDGRLDLVVSNSGADTLYFFAGKANGEFDASPRVITTGDGPQGMAAGDLDGDGDPDYLAVANRAAATVGVYLSVGTSSTTAPTSTLPTRLRPTALLSGPLDGDAADDLVVLDQDRFVCSGGTNSGNDCAADSDCGGGTCTCERGSIEIFTTAACPSGTLCPKSTVPLLDGECPRGGALSDLDGDGNLDLAVTDFTGGQVLLFKGVGDGTFTAAGSLTGLAGPAALAVLDFDPLDPLGPDPDLAVLSFTENRTDLFRNDGGLMFSAAPTTPASPWKATSALALFAADAAVANDIVLLQGVYDSLTMQCLASPPSVDVLSGIGNGFFRAQPALSLAGPTCATGMAVADLRQDGLLDLLVVDEAGSTVTVVNAEPSGLFTEGQTVPVGAGPRGAAVGALIADPDDFDLDGVPDLLDNCPTRYNPGGCEVTDAACFVKPLCDNSTLAPTDCAVKDPTTLQCDSDGNGIGDQCQLLGNTCLNLDTDGDLVSDYDSGALARVSTSDLRLDFDRDGVANVMDNCPTLANANQADLNVNGIGDACEVPLVLDLNGNCTGDSDKDGDGVCDYDPRKLPAADPVVAALDNCLGVYNPRAVCSGDPTIRCADDSDCAGSGSCIQPDNDGDRVGNACIIDAALDNCPWIFNNDQADADRDGIGDACAGGVNDIVTVSPSTGELTVLTGDGSGSFREASWSPLSGFASPSAALVGGFSLSCFTLGGTSCDDKATNDIAVVEQGMPGNYTDDQVTVLMGDGRGSFSTRACEGGSNNGGLCTMDSDCPGMGGFCRTFGPVAARGDPIALLSAPDQPVCANPATPTSDPGMRFDSDSRGTTLAVVEPGTSRLRIYLPSSAGLVPPPGHPAPLPLASPPSDATFVDLNQDGVMDLVSLSSGDGNPSTPNVEIYMGIADGLFYTDPSFNPAPDGVRDGATHIATGNVNLATDLTYPDVVLFDNQDAAPIVLTNILKERADIDGSGRVDGFDLAILARTFGALRGEDFTIQADGTLLQSGSGFSRVVVGTRFCVGGTNDAQCCSDNLQCPGGLCGAGTTTPGQDIPDFASVCNQRKDSLTCSYGLPVDLNLDGVVDGEDLALLASLFGRSL